MLSLTQIKNTVARKMGGASLDDVEGISDYSIFGEAAKNLLSHIDPYETVRHGELSLYNRVFDYGLSSAAPDLKGKKVLDLRPQDERWPSDDFRQALTEQFDRDKAFEDQWFSVEFDEGTKFLRVNQDVSESKLLTSLTATEYTVGSGVTNLVADTVFKLDGAQSIRFDAASGTNLLEWNGTALDLSSHANKSSFFLKVYIPDASIFTSLTIRVGSSSTAYYTMTGQIHFGSVRNGINLFRFDWNGATETGTVDETVMDYVRFALVTTGADTDYRIGRLSSKLPVLHNLVYYSNCLFKPISGSTWLQVPTADTDTLLLEGEAENIYIYECMQLIADALQDANEAQKHRRHLGIDDAGLMTGGGLYGDYRKDKPSEAIKPSMTYYSMPRRSGRTWKPHG